MAEDFRQTAPPPPLPAAILPDEPILSDYGQEIEHESDKNWEEHEGEDSDDDTLSQGIVNIALVTSAST